MLASIDLADTGVEYGPPIIFAICWMLEARADAARMEPPEFGYRPLWGTCAEKCPCSSQVIASNSRRPRLTFETRNMRYT